jgi:hypothetical protein
MHLAAESQAPNWSSGESKAVRLTDLFQCDRVVTLKRIKEKRERTAAPVFGLSLSSDACAISNHSRGLDRVLHLLDLGCTQSEARAKAGAAARASDSCRLHGVRVRFALCGGSAFWRPESQVSSRAGMDRNARCACDGCGGGFRNLGATAHWKKLERPGNDPKRARARPQRPLRANSPSDLYRTSICRGRNSNRNRGVSSDCGLSSDCDRLRGKSETRRGFSRHAVRAGI